MKIVEVISELKNKGGAEVFFVNFCISLKEKIGDNLVVIILYEDICPHFKKMFENSNINYYVCYKKKGFDFKASKRFKKIINEVKPDVLHLHLQCQITYFLAFGTKKQNFSLFHTCHTIAERDVNFSNKIIKKILLKNNLLKEIAISDFIAESLRKIYGTTYDFPVIYNGIKIKRDVNKIPSFKKYDAVILARFYDVKNHEFLIKNLQGVIDYKKDFKLLCCGDGPNLENIRNMVKEYGFEKNVVFLGMVDDPYPYLYDSKISILCSKFEGNPLSVLESLDCGVPILAPSVGGLPDIVKSYNNGILYTPNNSYDFVKKLKLLLDKYKIYSKKILEDNSFYSIENCVSEHIILFRGAINEKNN